MPNNQYHLYSGEPGEYQWNFFSWYFQGLITVGYKTIKSQIGEGRGRRG